MKTESAKMHNAKRELLRQFNEPAFALSHLTRLQSLVADGLSSPARVNVKGNTEQEPDDIQALAWLANLVKVVHNIDVLVMHQNESFDPGELVPECQGDEWKTKYIKLLEEQKRFLEDQNGITHEKKLSQYEKSQLIDRAEVERIAFDPRSEASKAENAQSVLNTAALMERGEDPSMPGQKIDPRRIWFIRWEDGIKIWLD